MELHLSLGKKAEPRGGGLVQSHTVSPPGALGKVSSSPVLLASICAPWSSEGTMEIRKTEGTLKAYKRYEQQ